MAIVEERLAALGMALPPPAQPPGVALPFEFVRLIGNRALISGHAPQNSDGSIARPLGKLGRDVAVEEGYDAARRAGLSILGSLQRALGDLDRIVSWGRVFVMVNCTPEFSEQVNVANGFSDLILELFGPETGAHSRSAVGMSGLPFDIPVEIEGEVQFT